MVKFTGCKTLEIRLNSGGVRTLAGQRVSLNLGLPQLISLHGALDD
jgi:hypothetical protein